MCCGVLLTLTLQFKNIIKIYIHLRCNWDGLLPENDGIKNLKTLQSYIH